MAGCHVDAEKSVSEHVPNSPSHPEYTKHDVNQIAYTGIEINLPPAFLGKGREKRRVRVRHVPLRVPVGT